MRLIRNQDGGAAVELAMIAPILLFILAGVVDYGRYLVQGMQISAALQAAVQSGLDADKIDLAAVKKVATDNLGTLTGAVVATPIITEECPPGSTLDGHMCTGYGKPQLNLTVSATAPFKAMFLPRLTGIARQAQGRLR